MSDVELGFLVHPYRSYRVPCEHASSVYRRSCPRPLKNRCHPFILGLVNFSAGKSTWKAVYRLHAAFRRARVGAIHFSEHYWSLSIQVMGADKLLRGRDAFIYYIAFVKHIICYISLTSAYLQGSIDGR